VLAPSIDPRSQERGETTMTNNRNKLFVMMQLYSIVLVTMLIPSSGRAQAPSAPAGGGISSHAGAESAFKPRLKFWMMPWGSDRFAASEGVGGRSRASGIALSSMGGGPILPVIGSATLGRLTKWTGFTGSNSLLGETTVFEDKSGKVGIGTDTPTSRLTVAGLIETTLGGYKFPDGTIQTTALSSGDVVRSLDSLKGDVGLLGGRNITISDSAVPNSLMVDVNVPLVLTGSVENVIQAANTGKFNAVSARGGDSSAGRPGSGVVARGGDCHVCRDF